MCAPCIIFQSKLQQKVEKKTEEWAIKFEFILKHK